jgi:hypothetical protein
MTATVTKLTFERGDRPLMPCPDVQPPAVLAPTIRAAPPTIARATEICVDSMTGLMPRKSLKRLVPMSIPAAKIIGIRYSHAEILFGDGPVS